MKNIIGSITTALVILGLCATSATVVVAQCSSPANAIVAENCLPGSLSSDWDIYNAGDPSIQGFPTDISVNVGQTVYFKINTNATNYRLDIYRMGYYGGMGARKVATINPAATLPQVQPSCLTDVATNLFDCGNWAVSASWAVPSNATSGIYFAHLVRGDTGGDSHIVFIVRNDASQSTILFQTADETWQAYNAYGGNSLYGQLNTFDLPNRAYKVSYNRPFDTRGFSAEDATWVFGAEYPMVRWLESNGYDVTYFTGVDAARSGALIKNHKIYLSVGHDEYWSGPRRANVEAALSAGVNLAFFSGNEVFWKTRWENSIDGTNTAYKTLVCYKETLAGTTSGGVLDPADPPTWTGTWRDPRSSPPADGGRPENALTGNLFMVNGPGTDNPGNLSLKVPAADGKMRFWRNTAVASQLSNGTYTLPAGTLGYEWDTDIDNGSRPPGAFGLSTTSATLTADLLLDYGATYGAGSATHHLMMYRAPSGALVFGAGTVQWSWGLDDNHDNPFPPYSNADPDVNMQQATLNLFADMGVQPGSIQPGLVLASKSTDTSKPVSTILSPTSGATIVISGAVTISGTAQDFGGGQVGGVEVSVDGGITWHPASGRASWTYSWIPSKLGSTTIRTRAVDDSGNIETPGTGHTVTVAAHDCPCDGWTSTTTPTVVDAGDAGSLELGVKFQTDYDGYVTGIRFYKSAANTGSHVGNLWTSTGALLSSAAFTNETSSGWQQVIFGIPVAVSAGTTYVASYFAPNGHYSADSSYFALRGAGTPPVLLLASGVSGPNGVYQYGNTSSFPTGSYNSTNYWVDVVFIPSGSMAGSPSAMLVLPPTSLSFNAYIGQGNPAAKSISIYNEGSGTLSWASSKSASWLVISPTSGSMPSSPTISVNTSGLAAGTYTGTVTITPSGGSNPAQVINVSLTLTNLLMSSNFDSGSLAGWLPSPLGLSSNWSIVAGGLQYNGGGQTQLYAGNAAWTDYTVQASIKLSSLSDYPGGIRGRVNKTTGASYAAWVYPTEGLLRLYKTTTWDINAGYTQLGQIAVGFDNTRYHTVGLKFTGTQIQAVYDGAAVITVTDATNTSGMVALDVATQPVSFDNVLVTASTASVVTLIPTPTSMTFSANFLGPNPVPQTLQIAASGTASLAFTVASTVPWLTVSIIGGTTTTSLQVAANVAGLNPGTYNGAIQITGLPASNSPLTVNVTLTVAAPAPLLTIAPASLNFQAVGATNPPAQTLSITNGNPFASFNWSGSTDSSWLHISSASGSSPANVSISVDKTGLALGQYSGNVTVTAAGIAGSPKVIPVSFAVLAQDLTETFTSSALGWIISPMGLGSGWTASSGTYSFNGTGLSQSCAGNGGWTDYTFDTNIKLSNLNNWPGGVRGRVNPTTGAGYAVWLYPGSNLAVLYRVGQWDINGALASIAQGPLTFDSTTYHDLKMVFQGSQISVYWDGALLMSANDNTYPSGFVCMDADVQPVSYQNIRVSSTQTPVVISVSPTSIVFNASPGVTPPPQTVNVMAVGGSTSWNVSVSGASWLTATPTMTMTPGGITVSANTTGLGIGTYNGTITLVAPGATGSPITIPVTLAVKSAILAVNPASLVFFGATTYNAPGQPISITNAGTGSLSWAANADSSWLGLSPASGTAPGTTSVTANSSSLAVGQYSGNISISTTDASNGPATIPVSLQVGNLLFSDNFATSPDSNWTISPLGFGSGWNVVNGNYTYDGSGHTQSWAGSPSWIDYTVSADVQLASLNDYPGGIRGRVNTTTGGGYGVWIYPAEGVVRLYAINQWSIDNGFQWLGQSGQLTMDTNWHNMRLVFKGATIQVYYDNALTIQVTDATNTQGAVALDVSNQPIAFKNVTVIGF